MALMMAVFLILFFIVEALGVPLLTDPTPWMKHGGILAASLGVGLLIADVLLPVPSSLVMVAHGALFGVVIGTLLSLIGSVGAALFGFAIGRRGGKLLERLVSAEERARADQLLRRWGVLAIIVTRPVPLLAETVAIMAGSMAVSRADAADNPAGIATKVPSLSWWQIAVAALAGSLPPALLYALTGAAVANFQSTVLMFGLVMLIAGFFWFVGQRVEPLLSKRQDPSV
jgi:uncharacterized membrane protein YdjX (TVP38/TMEM64 family)